MNFQPLKSKKQVRPGMILRVDVPGWEKDFYFVLDIKNPVLDNEDIVNYSVMEMRNGRHRFCAICPNLENDEWFFLDF